MSVPDPPSSVPPARSRLDLAVLFDHLNFFGRGYEGQLREALCRRARQSGHNLLLIYGGAIDEPTVLASEDNAIFHVLKPHDFDGIIVASALLSTYCGSAGVAKLLERYQGTHLCSIGTALPGIPSLVLDNRSGMEAAVEHLVVEHGCKRPAFLAGSPQNPEAEARFQAYRAVLARHGLSYDEARVESGHFLPALGCLAMEKILDSRVPCDGVVAANDSMAIGAIQALRKRSLRVPQDMPVVGFDDLSLARFSNPPLTTVAQPLELFADLAIASIEDQIAGRPVPAITDIPSRFVPRQSCGCSYRQARHTSLASLASPSLEQRLQQLEPTLVDMLKGSDDDDVTPAKVLAAGLLAELAGEKQSLESAVTHVLADVHNDAERRRGLLAAINLLRNELVGEAPVALERAFYDALSLVAMSSTPAQVQHRLDLDESGQQASTAFDLSSLRDSLVRALPGTGVKTALLSCLAEGGSAELESLVYLVDGKVDESHRESFPTSKLVPPSVLERESPSTLLVFPLVHQREILGVLSFDQKDGNNPYIAYRNQIAVVLRSVRLHEEVLRKTMLHERSVQEKMASAKRLEALSVLAGGVAHDLNNALGPMLVLPDIILRQVEPLIVDPETLTAIKDDIDSIKTGSRRAAQTIKDLLTLGRQGRRAKQDIELNRLVKSCVLNTPWTRRDPTGSTKLELELAEGPIRLQGAESQLARALTNLIRNAVDAIGQDGRITIQTQRLDTTSPRGSFETIPPGRYAVLTIADTGCGIAAKDLDRIFEPFFTRKRAGEDSGTGLGLAIVLAVVKEHDGYIDVASRVGKGTTFTIYFPARTAEESTRAKETEATTAQGRAKLLVIDDDQVQLRTYRRVLGQLGYEVVTAASGPLACDLFQRARKSEAPFDLVVVDMLLGEVLDGLQIVERIRSFARAQKAIIVSGHAPPERAYEAIHRGLTWLSKPYDMDTLAKAVADTLADAPRFPF